MTKTLVLLGDSIIDNIPYIAPGQPGVVAQIAARARGWRIDARALDGATAAEVCDSQLAAAIDPAALVVLSVGGNDALNHIDVVEDETERSAAVLLAHLHAVREAFRRDYVRALDRIGEGLADRRPGREPWRSRSTIPASSSTRAPSSRRRAFRRPQRRRSRCSTT